MGVSLERRNVHIGVSYEQPRNIHIGVSKKPRNVPHIVPSQLRNVHNGCSHIDGRGYRRKG